MGILKIILLVHLSRDVGILFILKRKGRYMDFAPVTTLKFSIKFFYFVEFTFQNILTTMPTAEL